MRKATVIVVSDRVFNQEREDVAGPLAVEKLLSDVAPHIDGGLDIAEPIIVPEGSRAVAREMDAALAAGVDLILTCGGTGLSPHNQTPEVTRERIAIELPGVATQMVIAGLNNSDKAGLSRGVVGVSGNGCVLVNAPGSRGGVKDAIGVLSHVLGAIYMQLDEPK